jgi:hypothetical protein
VVTLFIRRTAVRRFLYEDEMAKTLIEVDLLRQLLAFVAQIVDGNLCSKCISSVCLAATHDVLYVVSPPNFSTLC